MGCFSDHVFGERRCNATTLDSNYDGCPDPGDRSIFAAPPDNDSDPSCGFNPGDRSILTTLDKDSSMSSNGGNNEGVNGGDGNDIEKDTVNNNTSSIEQAHEIQVLAKELENNNCELPDRFVAGDIIAKLPSSWLNFVTSLKYKRQKFSVTDLIGSLGVEENVRAEDNCGKKFNGGSSANLMKKKKPHAPHNKKVKLDVKPNATTTFKKKDM
uniref:Uncharacterized protein n=1 Tax=Oryza brachyantha TaxID=4533 RepID=J3MS12_ORYBR